MEMHRYELLLDRELTQEQITAVLNAAVAIVNPERERMLSTILDLGTTDVESFRPTDLVKFRENYRST